MCYKEIYSEIQKADVQYLKKMPQRDLFHEPLQPF
jgi:ssDNA-specific exonuclease RecJ